MSKIYDCFCIKDELDILEIRLNILKDIVDYFVIVEADKTFTGRDKPLIFSENRDRFKEFDDRIIYVLCENMPQMSYGGKYIKMEEYQFNTRLNGLIDAKDDDIIIDSDVDEIVKPELIKEYSLSNKPLIKVLQTFSVVWFNRKYDEQWRSGPMLASCKDLRNGTFNLFRRNDKFFYSRPDMGWHFSWTGGVNRIIEKSLDHSEMLCKKENFDYQKMLERIKNGYDQNGKELFDIEDKDLPDYVVKNREKFAKYFWPEGLKLTEDL